MYIEVKIPFDEDRQLAMAYNRALQEGKSEWVLFLDHDVFLCNPRWYNMCLKAIDTLSVDPKAACITCESGGRWSKATEKSKRRSPKNSDIEYHIEKSKEYYYKYGNMVHSRDKHATGFFMLLKREIAQEIGFNQVDKSINNIDIDFGDRLLEAGYHIYTMKGLYVYHRRSMRFLRGDFKIQGNTT